MIKATQIAQPINHCDECHGMGTIALLTSIVTCKKCAGSGRRRPVAAVICDKASVAGSLPRLRYVRDVLRADGTVAIEYSDTPFPRE